jgi:lysophospholipase L1-like esterase
MLILKGEGQVKVLHIGDSHIQADLFSGRMRERLQTFFPGLNGGRGFIFPCKLAGTNNPFNLAVEFTGKWNGCRNIQWNKDCKLGLAGMSATTTDSVTTLKIRLKDWDYLHYDFNKVLVFFERDSSYKMELAYYPYKQMMIENPEEGYNAFLLDHYTDTLSFRFFKSDSSQKKFTLYGLSLETYDPGVVYSAVGVNGADASAFLRCSMLPGQLKTMDPDWVIISLGTNDSYVKDFKPALFEANMDSLICRIRSVIPGVPILLTVPGDNYRKRRYLNNNVPLAREVILSLAKKYDCAVWDLFTIMGGLNSINSWMKSGLSAYDKLHYTREGYYLQGDLMFAAFMNSYDHYLDHNHKVNITHKEY